MTIKRTPREIITEAFKLLEAGVKTTADMERLRQLAAELEASIEKGDLAQ